MTPDQTWLLSYFPTAWSAHMCQGLAMSILGPSQPYLALAVGVGSEEISLIWSLLALGSCLATLATGAVFKTRIRQQRHKLLFLSACVTICGVFVSLVPRMVSFPLLLLVVTIAGMFIGGLDTASNSLVIYTLGPARSPPFTASLHAMVGLGFMLGSLVVRPFLPEQEDGDTGGVCSNMVSGASYNVTTLDVTNQSQHHGNPSLPDLVYPFNIVSGIHFLSGAAFVALVVSGVKMPVHEEENLDLRNKGKENRSRTTTIMFILTFFYFACSTGLEGFFQSQIFTFGMCGPHQMLPKTASLLHTVHFISFLAGRFCGVFLSSRLRPLVLILGSLIGCVLSSLLLSLAADKVISLLFLGTGAVGLFVSIQFASGISWLAERLDLTGRGASVVFLGGYFGWLVAPPLAGQVVTVGIFHAALALTTCHLLLFGLMVRISRSLREATPCPEEE